MFLTGDELGNIKTLRYFPEGTADGQKTEVKTIHDGTSGEKPKGVQKLCIGSSSDGKKLLAAAYSDGSASTFLLNEEVDLKSVHEWRETRYKSDSRYVGLAGSEKGIYSCTSNGALRLTSPTTSQTASLPTRLCDWHLSSDQESFAYGGEEVELSVWNTEQAFAARAPQADSDVSGKKRKRGDALFPGEIWRAKNVANDSLGLRQPVHNTSLTFLGPHASSSHHHLLAGTRLGDVRRYDTRAARKPVSDWHGIGKIGGINAVAKGMSEHEVFVADHGCNLFALDLRTGRTIYGYKGISGAVTSIAPSPSLLASTALDRYARIHSTFAPPAKVGEQQERKGQVLEKVFMKSTPTVVVWDGEENAIRVNSVEEGEEEGGDVWEGMENVGEDSDDEEEEEIGTKRAKGKRARAS
ncbi:hypothetical protein PLICRDRAFT_629267 [Plicaturopsis crispa FD-325 SS-3]|nr:hypothetical protein PLICRDRAFT_629267 [Plicaturopsis crispa FD-325 SS-3]